MEKIIDSLLKDLDSIYSKPENVPFDSIAKKCSETIKRLNRRVDDLLKDKENLEKDLDDVSNVNRSSDIEKIVAAAVQYQGVTFSLPQPARHSHVMWALEKALRLATDGKEEGKSLMSHFCCQGFLTSTGRFVNRIEAKNIAFLAGQKPRRPEDSHPTDAFSEDFW
jgi:hypothetical protein